MVLFDKGKVSSWVNIFRSYLFDSKNNKISDGPFTCVKTILLDTSTSGQRLVCVFHYVHSRGSRLEPCVVFELFTEGTGLNDDTNLGIVGNRPTDLGQRTEPLTIRLDVWTVSLTSFYILPRTTRERMCRSPRGVTGMYLQT